MIKFNRHPQKTVSVYQIVNDEVVVQYDNVNETEFLDLCNQIKNEKSPGWYVLYGGGHMLISDTSFLSGKNWPGTLFNGWQNEFFRNLLTNR